MCLPPHTDDLVSSVLKVRPDAVVVTQSGTPVAMPWVNQAQAMVQMWYGGNEGGNGLADVLFGDINPVGGVLCARAAQKPEGRTCQVVSGHSNYAHNYSCWPLCRLLRRMGISIRYFMLTASTEWQTAPILP